MMLFVEHDSAECPECGFSLYFGTKEEATGWKVYYECGARCGWVSMAGWIKLGEVDTRDEVQKRAREMGEQWG